MLSQGLSLDAAQWGWGWNIASPAQKLSLQPAQLPSDGSNLQVHPTWIPSRRASGVTFTLVLFFSLQSLSWPTMHLLTLQTQVQPHSPVAAQFPVSWALLWFAAALFSPPPPLKENISFFFFLMFAFCSNFCVMTECWSGILEPLWPESPSRCNYLCLVRL